MVPFIVKYKKLSSANSLASEDFSESGRSLIYAKKAMGLRPFPVELLIARLPSQSYCRQLLGSGLTGKPLL